jgi:hypothetical protein
LYPVGRVVTYLSMGMLKLLGLKGRRYVSQLHNVRDVHLVFSDFFQLCLNTYFCETGLKLKSGWN